MQHFFSVMKQHGKRVEKEKGQFVFRQGEGNPNLYFIESGLLKAFYHTDDGKEFVKSFIKEGDVIGSLIAAYHQQLCSFNLQCLQDCVLYQIPLAVVIESSKNNNLLANEIIELLMNFSMKKERREYEFLCLDAPSRYLQLMETYPDLSSSVTQTDIARYLGITNVALSRIKKRLEAEAD